MKKKKMKNEECKELIKDGRNRRNKIKGYRKVNDRWEFFSWVVLIALSR